MFGEEESQTQPNNQDLLQRVTDLARHQQDLERKLLIHEEVGKELYRQYTAIAGGHKVEGALPKALAEAGVDSLVLDNGLIVEKKGEVKPPSMAAASLDRETILTWVDDTGQGGIIKDEVKVDFEKGDPKVQALMKFLAETQLAYDRFRTIHPATLTKHIKDWIEEGKPIDLDALKIQQYTVSVVKEPKAKKVKV